MNDELWVEQRLRALDAGGKWQPDAGKAFATLRRRDRQRRNWRRGLIWSTAMASVAMVALTALPAPAKCALVGVGCPRPAHMAVLMAPKVAAAPRANYKESGSPSAPVVCEIYSDYECPSCANFYTAVYPEFVNEFVRTGKVRIVHRDFPLPQHPFARLAARYANAAGETGHYDEVVSRLFASQAEWTASGNIDAAVMQVLPPGTMQQVRELVNGDSHLDDTVAADFSMVVRDQINQTPTLVFVYKGTRRKVVGPPSIGLLRSYLQQMLAQ